MCDENGECDVPEEGRMRFWFLIPKDREATYVSLMVKYGGIALSIRIEDSEDADEDLADIWEYLPGLVSKAKGERDIRNDMDGVDAELEALLEGDE